MNLYFTLFAWEIINREAGTFVLHEWISVDVAKGIHLEYNKLIKQAADKVEHIIESLNIPSHALYVPIAKDYVEYNKVNYEGEVIRAKM